MLDVGRFLLVAEVLGVAALPLVALLLGRLPGAGLAFAKPLGLLAAAFPVWLLASVGVPYRYATAALAVVGLVAAGVLLVRRRGRPARRPLDRRLLIASEAVFLAAFLGGALLAAFSPDVRGTEKPMDMALVTAVNASPTFPPHDPWMAGEDLNYYYLGHYLMAFVVRLSGVEPSVGYNLALAFLLALSAVAAFGLGASLTAGSGSRYPVLVGIATAVGVCVAGNLDAAQRLFADGGPLARYDWFAASRVIPDTINEFPAFSFVLGDLHAHVLVIPWTLLALAFALQVALTGPRWLDVLPAGILTGATYAINAWSLPVTAGLMVLAPVVWLRDPGRVTSRRRAAGWALAVLWVALLAAAPFWLAFEPSTRGVGLVGDRRPLSLFARDQVLILGAFGWVLLAAFGQRLLAGRRPGRAVLWATVAALVAGSLLASSRLMGALLVAGLVVAALVAAWRRPLAGERFGWLLIAGGLTCVLAPELVYVRDEFDGSALYRMNTVFKLGYQAWILLAVMAAGGLPRVRRWLPAPLWRLWASVALVLFAATLIFPVAGTYARKDAFADGPRLSGTAWLASGDRAAVAWLRDHAAGDAVVAEAVGDDYSAFGHTRISSFSGRAAVMGWEGHERQWGHDPGARRADVMRLYRAPEPFAVRDVVRRYGIDYVVAGPLERADYGTDGLAKFDALGSRVLDRAGTTVWRLR